MLSVVFICILYQVHVKSMLNMSGSKVPDFDAHIGAGQIVYEC